MPQPLSKVPYSGSLFLGNNTDNPADNRPELALLAMKVIADWSILQSFLSATFIRMLGANPGPGSAMYSTLSNTASQKAALRAVARLALSAEENEIFEVILGVFSSAAKERNKIAHWVWGHVSDLPEAVLLCDPGLLQAHQTAVVEHATDPAKEAAGSVPDFPYDSILVYVAEDFLNTSAKIQRVIELLAKFRFLLIRSHPVNWDGKMLEKLRAEPEIQEFIARREQKADG